MTTAEILAQPLTKTRKIELLLEAGLTRKEVAQAMSIGYGFVQNVYARKYGVSRTNNRQGRIIELAFNFIFNRKFGVEIEAHGIGRTALANALNAAGINATAENYNHTTRNHWKIVTDGSLSGADGFEVVSPVLQGENGLEQLKTVCRVLKQLNAKINKSCGLHIHFDAQDFQLNDWKNIYKNYITFEETIDTFMPMSRRANNNRYCRSLKTNNAHRKIDNATSLESIERAITGRDRYYKLNTQSYWRHSTVEFRQHSGTIEFEKISNWILFLARFVEFSRSTVAQSGTFESMERFLNPEIKTYFTNRRLALAA